MRQSGFSIASRALAIGVVAMMAACVQAPPPAPPAPPMADRVVVHKSTRTLELLRDGKAFATFPVALGSQPYGPKQQQGDGKTPEGVYRIDYKSMQSRYTRALHVSYPDENDRARAQAMGIDPGGAIFVHGLPNEYGPVDPPPWQRDWTEGCISVGNVAIVKIWDAVPDGTPIEIRPSGQLAGFRRTGGPPPPCFAWSPSPASQGRSEDVQRSGG